MASSDDPAALKRKRSTQGDAEEPAWKRPAIEPCLLDDKAKDKFRTEVASLFASYHSLHDAPDDGAAVVDFQALLDAAQGDCVSRRLAARLIPRFIAKLPQQADTAAAILIDLHEYKQPALHAVPALVEQTRRDALQGLGSILAAVPADAALDQQQPTNSSGVAPAMARMLDYLLRLLLEGGDADDEPAEEGELGDAIAVTSLLHKAFRSHSRAMLMFVMQALQGTDVELQSGARSFSFNHLLRERRRPQHHKPSSSSAASGSSSGPGPPDDFDDLGPSTSGSGAKCLASEVLLGSEALQGWLHERLAAMQQDPKAAASKESRALLERLLQLLPPPVPPDDLAATQQQQQVKPLARQGSREAHHHHHHHHAHERRHSGGHATAANGVGGAAQQQEQQHAGMNGNLHATTARLAGLSTVEPAPQWIADTRRERRDLFPPPGGSVCRAEPCLWLANLPPNITAAALSAALARSSPPREVYLLDSPARDEACAVFATVKEAAFCFEAMAGTPLLGPARVRMEFCGAMPSHSPTARHPSYRPSAHIWLAGGVPWGPQDIAAAVVGAGLAQPQQIFTVAGASPGYLVLLPHAGQVDAAVAALQRHAREAGALLPQQHPWAAQQQQQPSPGSVFAAGRAASMPHLQQPQQQLPPQLQRHQSAASYQGAVPMELDSPGAAAAAPAALPSPGAAAGGNPGSAIPGSGVPGSSTAGSSSVGSSSIWLGNLASQVPDEEYLQLVGRYGKVVGHKFLRGSNCGFMDFASHAAAARAKEELQGSYVGGCALRIDFARGAGKGAAAGAPPPGAAAPMLPNGAHLGAATAAGLHSRASFGRSSSGGSQQFGGPSPQQQQRRGEADASPAPGSSGQRLPRTHSGHHDASPQPFALSNGPARTPHAAAAAAGVPPPLPSGAPPPLPTAPPPQLPPGGGGPGTWCGTLCKSGTPYCVVRCTDGPPAGPIPPLPVLSPSTWPPQLNVTLRVTIPQVLEQYRGAAAAHRTVRWLAAGPGGSDAVGLQKFGQYLSERARAGVVKMPGDAAGGLPNRTMYILALDPGVCSQMGVELGPRDVLMAVVIISQPRQQA